MSYSQSQLIVWYKEGNKDRKASNMFIEGNALYSYGKHFPLAIRHSAETSMKHHEDWYLLNGDVYSPTTNRHQWLTFRAFENHPRVSFNAIRAGGLEPFSEDIILVDFTKDETKYNYTKLDGTPHPSYHYYNDEPNVDKKGFIKSLPMGAMYSERILKNNYVERDKYEDLIEQKYHRIGGVLLEYHGEYYLCAMDENNYFVSKLAHPAKSVYEAFQGLKPDYVKKCESEGQTVRRQGEWFFIPTGLKENKDVYLTLRYDLPRPTSRGNVHLCAAGIPVTLESEGIQACLCRGMIRHINQSGSNTGEHRPLRLADVIHIAVRNTEKESWSSFGRVD